MSDVSEILLHPSDIDYPQEEAERRPLSEAEWAAIRERVEAGARERERQAEEQRRRNTTVLPNGQVVSGYGSVVEWTDSDGEVYRETPLDRVWKERQHRAWVLACKAEVARSRVALATKSVAVQVPTPRRTPSSGRPAGRTNRTRRTSGSRGDPGDGEPEPPVAALREEVRP